jgi:hypothetical protein
MQLVLCCTWNVVFILPLISQIFADLFIHFCVHPRHLREKLKRCFIHDIILGINQKVVFWR